MPHPAALRDVRLLGLPLDVWWQARQGHEDLERELTSLRSYQERVGCPPEVVQGSLPGRYLSFARAAADEFAELTEQSDRLLSSAHERGDRVIDLNLQVPDRAAAAALQLSRLLADLEDLADRSGNLIIQTAEQDRVFREWYLNEFVAQLSGGAPTRWSHYLAQHGPAQHGTGQRDPQ